MISPTGSERAPALRLGGGDPLMQAYHDTERGMPERNSRALWEKLMLDGFQAGPALAALA